MSKGSTTTNTEINPELLAMYKEVYSGAKSASEIPFQPYRLKLLIVQYKILTERDNCKLQTVKTGL